MLERQFTQTDPLPMGAGSAYESSYVYGGDNPNMYSDPSGLRRTKCNTSLGRQAGASFLGLASTFVPFYDRDFSQCEAQAVSKILAPATVVGSTLAAGSCGTLVGIGTLNPQMAAGAAGACGGVASGVAGGNLNLPDVSWGFAEGYSTAPPGNTPRVPGAAVDAGKFSNYVFKNGATHGKDAIFRSYGYGAVDSEVLAAQFQSQGAASYRAGNYVTGVLDGYGQRLTIPINLVGQGEASGRSTTILSGWMREPDGTIRLVTPFAGFSK